jgi:hypothetical protein
MVTTKPGRQGEREGNRKTIAQGMPVEPGEPVALPRAFLPEPRVHRTPGIPCALFFLLGANDLQNLGRSLSREREVVHFFAYFSRVIAAWETENPPSYALTVPAKRGTSPANSDMRAAREAKIDARIPRKDDAR